MPAARPAFAPARLLGRAMVVGAVAGLLYALAVDAGHTSIGYVLWGAMLGAVFVSLGHLVWRLVHAGHRGR